MILIQIIKCVKCDQPLGRIDAKNKEVYEIQVDDNKPKLRINKEGKPIKKDIKPTKPLFHINDRNTIIRKQEINEKGIKNETENKTTEEVTTEEPKTITCSCGYVNYIY